MRIAFLAAVFAALVSVSALADQYICIPAKMTGFAFDPETRDWEIRNFKPPAKFLIVQSKDNRAKYMIKEVGSNDKDGTCKDDFNDGGVLFCDLWLGELRFNRVNGRYLRDHSYGYYSVGPDMMDKNDETAANVAMEIGKCSSF